MKLSLYFGRAAQGVERMAFVESVLADVAFGLRMLLKHPAGTGAALVSLALGTGSCIAAFAVLNALILAPLPVREPHRLVQLTFPSRDAGPDNEMFSQPMLERLRSAAAAEIDLFGVSYQGIRGALFGAGDREEHVRAQWVTGNMFDTLGVQPAIGRLIHAQDDVTGASVPVAVLSHAFWVRRFGRNPDVIGARLRFPGRDEPFQIVGVAELRFTGIERGRLTDLWIPSHTWDPRAPSMPWWEWIRIFGRLKPGVDMPRAQAPLHTAFASFRGDRVFGADESRERVARYRETPLRVRSASTGPSSLQQQFERPLWILMLVGTLVFVIAGSNVGNLFLARAIAREHEMSLRIAVGAKRGRLVRQMLTETALVAAGATFVGWLFASFAARTIVRMIAPVDNPVFADLRNDWRIAAFLIAIAAGTTALFGLIPALRASGIAPMGVIKSSGARAVSGARALRPLAGVQIAVSSMVLFVAGLFVASFARLSAVDIGFRADDLIVAAVESRQPMELDRSVLLNQQIVDTIGRLPRVEGAALSNWAPFRQGGLTVRVRMPGSSGDVDAYVQRVTPAFFDTVGIRLVNGRNFRYEDVRANPHPVVVNEALARRLADLTTVIGQRLSRIEEREIVEQEIIGVVRDARTGNLRLPAPPTLYDLFAGVAPIQTLLVRGPADSSSLVQDIRREVARIDPSLRVGDVIPQSRLVQDAFLRERVLAVLSGFLALVGLVLAAVGLYGVLSYSVVQQTRDIGIRLALGADPFLVSRWVIADIGKVVVSGMVVGLGFGVLVASRLTPLFYGVRLFEVWSVAAPAGSLLLAALFAAVPPARRAARIDPIVALRYE
jgi:predicted permease